MKFNLLSDKKRTVYIGLCIGIALIAVDNFLQFHNIPSGLSRWIAILGGIAIFWSIFSYYYIVVKRIKLNPSRLVGNTSFIILSALWGILMLWLNLS